MESRRVQRGVGQERAGANEVMGEGLIRSVWHFLGSGPGHTSSGWWSRCDGLVDILILGVQEVRAETNGVGAVWPRTID